MCRRSALDAERRPRHQLRCPCLPTSGDTEWPDIATWNGGQDILKPNTPNSPATSVSQKIDRLPLPDRVSPSIELNSNNFSVAEHGGHDRVSNVIDAPAERIARRGSYPRWLQHPACHRNCCFPVY